MLWVNLGNKESSYLAMKCITAYEVCWIELGVIASQTLCHLWGINFKFSIWLQYNVIDILSIYNEM